MYITMLNNPIRLQIPCILNPCIPSKSRGEVKASVQRDKDYYFRADKIICTDSFCSIGKKIRKAYKAIS